MRIRPIVFLVFLAGAPGRAQDLFVSSQTGPALGVIRYDGATGAPVGLFTSGASIGDPLGVAFGPDRNLYVADGRGNTVLRFDGVTGTFIDVFASGGGINGAVGLVFGPDGNLYVTSSNGHAVQRFDGSTGAFIDTFVASGSGGLRGPRGIGFGPDGHLYVVSYNDGQVLRYDGATGAFLGIFVPPVHGLVTPSLMKFGPGRHLFICSLGGVLRYDGVTGAFLGRFATVPVDHSPIDLEFGADGHLYVVIQGAFSGVRRFDGATGAFIDDFVTDRSGGLASPFGFAFSPASPLSVGWASYSATPFEDSVAVTWRTLAEDDTLLFTVEQASHRLGPFVSVGSYVEARGHASDYATTLAASGARWFRIVEHTSDGRGDMTPPFPLHPADGTTERPRGSRRR